MLSRKIVSTSVCTLSINNVSNWINLHQLNLEAYRYKYEINGKRYSIGISILPNQGVSAKKLSEKKYNQNVNSAFSGENIPPFQLPKNQAGLITWSFRYRWVDGGSAPYRKQEFFTELNDKIIHFSYMERPGNFDQGLIEMLQIVQSIKPI